jgi:MarR family transcriptional regulator, lower aerobic nicotinate degradation pathway regulator
LKNSYKLLSDLIPLIADYEATNQKMEMKGFLHFASQKTMASPQLPDQLDDNMQMMSNQIGFYLNYLYRFFKNYTKSALRNSPISSPDDFVFMATLSRAPSMRKTDLIKINMMEMPSGIEVIKRLVKYKLVSEFDDPDDKRSVQIKLTDKGKKELGKIFVEMNIVGNVLIGNLQKNEIKQLHALLDKLFNHHQLIKDIDISEGLQDLLK